MSEHYTGIKARGLYSFLWTHVYNHSDKISAAQSRGPHNLGALPLRLLHSHRGYSRHPRAPARPGAARALPLEVTAAAAGRQGGRWRREPAEGGGEVPVRR